VSLWLFSLLPLYYYGLFLLIFVSAIAQCPPHTGDCP
jgi:hypothetical protein